MAEEEVDGPRRFPPAQYSVPGDQTIKPGKGKAIPGLPLVSFPSRWLLFLSSPGVKSIRLVLAILLLVLRFAN